VSGKGGQVGAHVNPMGVGIVGVDGEHRRGKGADPDPQTVKDGDEGHQRGVAKAAEVVDDQGSLAGVVGCL